MVCVCFDFHQRVVFIGSWVSSIDLVEVVTHQVVTGRLGGMSSTALAFLFSCRHVSMKLWSKPT
jgi:hypothetical protein